MEKIKLSRFRPGKTGLQKALGDLEAEIMELVWKEEEASVRDIHRLLEKKRDIAYTTVMTVMGRLAEKGLLEKEKLGKMYLYRPALSEEEFNRSITGSSLSGLKGDLAQATLAYFVDNLSSADDETLAELERMIQEKRKSLK
jgi:predicted transcriptional regulator